MSDKLSTYSDLVDAVVAKSSTAVEDDIIARLPDLATLSGTYTVTSGTYTYTISGTTYTGTSTSGSWSYTVISGSESDVADWRLNHYRDVYSTAQKAQKKRVYYDSVTTVSGRSDMSDWDNLLDDDTSTGVDYTISGTFYIELEKPTAQWTTAVRCRVDTDSYGFFASSDNNSDWTYYAAASGSHTLATSGTLTSYTTMSGAEDSYIEIDTGNNIYSLPDGIDVAYNRLYLTTTGTNYTVKLIDFDFSNTITADDIVAGTLNTNLAQVSSSDGKVLIDGNTIVVYDADDNIVVKLGYLG